MRIAAVADIHVQEDTCGDFRALVRNVCAHADVLVLPGDLTHRGTPAEAEALANVLKECAVPVVAVLGNHDFESGQEGRVSEILREAGVHVLDGDCFQVDGVGFAGVKGFAGGFDNRMLLPWGESLIKQWVYESVDQAVRLEKALERLETPTKVAVLHYSPIHQTVEGEPREILTFLGCSRLAEPIDRQGVTVVFHGHAHHGTHEGRTSRGIPVLNVAMPVLRKLHADRPYTVYEVA